MVRSPQYAVLARTAYDAELVHYYMGVHVRLLPWTHTSDVSHAPLSPVSTAESTPCCIPQAPLL
jgi:hypothetical protein